jgi:hypothetical protein
MMERDYRLIPNREAREVPKGWQHPKDAHGRYIPLLPYGYRLDDDEVAADRMMPAPGEDPWIAAYETTTEGTPISPAFALSRDLILYCAEHCTTYGDHTADAEAWAAILLGDAVILTDGSVIAHD